MIQCIEVPEHYTIETVILKPIFYIPDVGIGSKLKGKKSGDLYVIAKTGYNKLSLVNTNTGRPFGDYYRVCASCTDWRTNKISQEDIIKVIGHDWQSHFEIVK